jgi:hypothetical protein
LALPMNADNAMRKSWQTSILNAKHIRSAMREIVKDPRFVFDILYWGARGISVRNLNEKVRAEIGTRDALATLARTIMPVFQTVALSSLQPSDEDKSTDELGKLLTNYGSDKATRHEYHKLYGYLLNGQRHRPLQLLEIGIGSGDPDIPSNMGESAKPGASLRAFRDWGQSFEIFGADIDRNVLFCEERITTFLVDQRDDKSIQSLANHFDKHSIDVIIDDGLHEPWANINTLNVAFGLLKPGGYLVIEDIRDEHLGTWGVVACLLSNWGAQGPSFRLIRCKETSVFVLQASNLSASNNVASGLP